MRNVLLWIEIIQLVQIGKVIIGYHGDYIKDFQIQRVICGVQWVVHDELQVVVKVQVVVVQVVVQVQVQVHSSKYVIRKLLF